MSSGLSFKLPPPPSFTMRMGEDEGAVDWAFRVRKTRCNRLKYWLFCKFFPFRIIQWEKED